MWTDELRRLNACEEAIGWAEQYPAAEQAWNKCERGDWLLWIATQKCDRRLVVKAACAVARQVLCFVPDTDQRPLSAIESAEAWTRGECGIQEVISAADDACSIDDAGGCDAYRSYSASYAASCAADTVYAEFGDYPFEASNVAYYTADAEARAAHATSAPSLARQESLKRSADIVRGIIAFADLKGETGL